MIDFPASPTVGQQFPAAGVTWVWDGTKWTASGLGVAYLPTAGGTMTGPIVLAADPAAAMQPATKQYVDGGRLGDNRIINGDMRIDQRNNGASGTANASVYTVDRWMYQGAQASKGTWQRQTGGGPSGFPYYLAFSSSSAYASLAADYFVFSQPIEADMVSDFAWGTANAQPVTLSFWALSSLTGTFSGSLRNGATNNRAYPFSYSIPTASAWTRIVITIPGDTGGTWTLSGNTSAVTVSFDLGSGTSQRGPAGAWAASPYLGVTGSVSIVAINGAGFYVTGVKLEIGSVATPYNRQSLTKSLADCQRYYSAMSVFYQTYQAASNGFGQEVTLPATMRASPTVAFSGTTYINASGIALGSGGTVAVAPIATATALGAVRFSTTMTADAEL